jgi:PTS system nitrogen regulatory IIA component
MRLADRGKLPGRKVGGQWRFSRADIHHWLENRIGVSDEEGLVRVENVLQKAGGVNDQTEICIAEMLSVEAIAVPFAARTRSSVFTSIVELAARTGHLWDPETMAAAIRDREDMYPTTLDNGVALLHPRRPMASILGQAVLALGIAPSGIAFGGERGALTDVFFLIGSVEDRGHLRTLARLSRIIAAQGFLDALRNVPDAVAAHRLIAETESVLPG